MKGFILKTEITRVFNWNSYDFSLDSSVPVLEENPRISIKKSH